MFAGMPMSCVCDLCIRRSSVCSSLLFGVRGWSRMSVFASWRYTQCGGSPRPRACKNEELSTTSELELPSGTPQRHGEFTISRSPWATRATCVRTLRFPCRARDSLPQPM